MGHFLTRLGVYIASPLAFLVRIIYAALWYVFKPETFEWHAVATLATWGMTLVIQRAERPTGLGHGVYKDNVDYGVYCGGVAPV